MQKKQGMEIAVNTLVVIIMGIVLMSMGFVLVSKIVKKSTDINNDISEELKERLRRSQLRDGNEAAVLNPEETIKRGSQGYFFFGIVNRHTVDEKFAVNLQYSESSPIDTEFKASTWWSDHSGDTDDLFAYDETYSYSLAPNQDEFFWLTFIPDKKIPPGKYLFDVNVCVFTDSGPSPSRCTAHANYGWELYAKERLFITVR